MITKKLWTFILVGQLSIVYANNHCSSFGEHSYNAMNVSVRSWDDNTYYSVGKFCSIADNVTIFLGGNHRTDWVSTYPFPAFSDVFPQARGIQGCATTKGNVAIGNDLDRFPCYYLVGRYHRERSSCRCL